MTESLFLICLFIFYFLKKNKMKNEMK